MGDYVPFLPHIYSELLKEVLKFLCLSVLRVGLMLFQLLMCMLDHPTKGFYMERANIMVWSRGQTNKLINLVFLQGTGSSNISIWQVNLQCCQSRQCKQFLEGLQSQSLVARSAYMALNWGYMFLRPWLWLGGCPSNEAYLVRKAKIENNLCCVILQNIETGKLMFARRLVVIVRPDEEFLHKVKKALFFQNVEQNANLRTRIRHAVKCAGGDIEISIDPAMFDMDTQVAGEDMEQVTCTVCLCGLDTDTGCPDSDVDTGSTHSVLDTGYTTHPAPVLSVGHKSPRKGEQGHSNLEWMECGGEAWITVWSNGSWRLRSGSTSCENCKYFC